MMEFVLRPEGGVRPDGEIELAESLMYVDVFPMCHCMHAHLHADEMCPDSRLHEAIRVWKPWCRLLNECQTVAEALLTAAYVCKEQGMHEYVSADDESSATVRNRSSVLCRDNGGNSCAIAMENLFITTHA